MSKEPHKVRLTGTIDPDVSQALEDFCRSHPKLSRSAVMAQSLRQFLIPEHQEERERVLTENLDRLYWHQHNQADRVKQELRTIKEMLALFVRTFYNHTPAVPEDQREAAAIQGQTRFTRFLEAVAENVGPGKSTLDQMPTPAPGNPASVPECLATATTGSSNASDSTEGEADEHH